MDSVSTQDSARRWFVLGLLTLIYALNVADRYVMSTLIEPIKAEMHLSDSAIGLLTGTSLALFYVTAGLPLAALADRSNRRNLIAAALATWSIMTAFCGLASSVTQLFLARIGVGIGEAGGTPPSTSLVSDYFPASKRPLALSIFTLGASLGSMLGSKSGYASDAWGWRSALLLLAAPGVVVAAVLLLTVKEPARGQVDGYTRIQREGLMHAFKFAISHRALMHAMLGAIIYTLWAWGLMWWTPSFLVRSHRLSLSIAGGDLSLIHGIGGSVVLLATTLAMARSTFARARAVPLFIMILILIATVPSIFAYSAANSVVAITMLAIFIPLSYGVLGPTYALIQNLAPPSMRAQMMAILLLFCNCTTLVIAPQVVGFASDDLSAAYGSDSLRRALVPLSFVGFWAALHYWFCARALPTGAWVPARNEG